MSLKFEQWANLHRWNKPYLRMVLKRYKGNGRVIKLKKREKFVEVYVKGSWKEHERKGYGRK